MMEKTSGVSLFNAIFLGVVGVLMLMGGILSMVSGTIELWASIFAIFGSLVGFCVSAFFFWAYGEDKRLEKERDDEEARRTLAYYGQEETKTPAEANKG